MAEEGGGTMGPSRRTQRAPITQLTVVVTQTVTLTTEESDNRLVAQ